MTSISKWKVHYPPMRRVHWPRGSFLIEGFCTSPPLTSAMRPSQRLARSAIDATRFTPTSPHAYSRSSAILHSTASHAESPSSSFQPNLPPRPSNPQPHQSPRPSSPPTETPAQKVARLRAEHLRNRQPKLTLWERIVIRGRVIADRAHFVTAVFLIGLTGKAAHILPPLRLFCPAIYFSMKSCADYPLQQSSPAS